MACLQPLNKGGIADGGVEDAGEFIQFQRTDGTGTVTSELRVWMACNGKFILINRGINRIGFMPLYTYVVTFKGSS